MEFGIQDLCELNKFLSAIAELAIPSGVASSQRVQSLCSSKVVSGRKHNHTRLLELGASLEFVARSRNNLALTPEGKRFLSLSSNDVYQLTQGQTGFFVNSLVMQGKLRPQAEVIFRLFERDYGRDTWVLDSVDRSVPHSLNWFFYLLIGLGVLEREESVFLIAKKFVPDVTRIITARTGPSPEELEAILGAKRKLGELGELMVKDFERKRLLSIGRVAEADLVSRISEIDTAAGYDIKSFDGEAPAYDYDRFIEVKTSSALNIQFIWSRNEYETAEVYADKYWIYFCGGVDQKDPRLDQLVMVQNPLKRLRNLGFTFEPSEYLVKCEEPDTRGRLVSFGQNLQATLL